MAGKRRTGPGKTILLWSGLLGAGLLLAPRPPARAQAPAKPSPPAVVTVIPAVETELLRVEVVVLDKQGRPVTDLKADDFVVLEEGQPQVLTHFQPAVPGAPSASTPPEAAAAAPAPAAMPAPPGRHLVLAIDDLHMSAGTLVGCKEALKRFISTEVSDEDEVAVVTTSGSVGLFQAFTKERAVLRRAIDRLAYRERRGESGGRATISEYQAAAIDQGDAEAMRLATQEIKLREMLALPAFAGDVTNPRSEMEARSMARSVLAQALETTNRTMSTLEGVVRSLGPVSGRKILVLVSDGFLIGHGTQDPRSFDMRRIFDASSRAGVSVYALHSRGLSATPSGGDASQSTQPDQTSPGIRDGYRRMSDLKERESMSLLAEGTGGFLVHGGNDLALGLARILRDSTSSYLMAYSPSHTARDGRFRSIEVKLPHHRGYTVRARKGYFAPDDRNPAAARPAATAESRRDQELRNGLAALVPLRGVPIQLAVDYVDLPPDGLQLVVRGFVDMNGVPFLREGDRHRAELDVVGVIYDENGQIMGDIQSYRAELNLTPANYEQLLREGIRYQKSVALKPGLYQVRLVAREANSSRVGSAAQWVQLPDLKAGALALSSVFLFAEAAGTGEVAIKDVQAVRRFPAGGSLYYRLYAYNPARDEQGRTDVVLQSQVWAAGKLQGVSPVEPVSFSEAAAPPQVVSGRITLEGLAPGEYELRVLLVDRKANANVLRRVSFTVG
jgi:VWFA-related protein